MLFPGARERNVMSEVPAEGPMAPLSQLLSKLKGESGPAPGTGWHSLGRAIGITLFMTIISSNGSATYLFASESAGTSLCDSSQWSPESGCAATAWVRLVVADICGAGKAAEEVRDGLWPKPVTTILLF